MGDALGDIIQRLYGVGVLGKWGSNRYKNQRILLGKSVRLLIREVIKPLDLNDQKGARNKKPWFLDQGIEKVGANGLEPLTSRMWTRRYTLKEVAFSFVYQVEYA